MSSYFYTHISYLLDLDMNDVVSFDIKYFFPLTYCFPTFKCFRES